MHGIGHLVVRDIAGACTQLVDLIRDQIRHIGQQVGLQAVHDLFIGPAGVHALLCVVHCLAGNAAHLIHELRVLHQLLLDLCTDFLHRGGTQLGLEELCVGLILHEFIHGQIYGVIHQRTGQVIPALIRLHDLLHQLQHHIADGLCIIRCLFLVIRHTKVINRIVHSVVKNLLDTCLRCTAVLHITCQLVHHIGDSVLRQEAVIQAALQVGNGRIQRCQCLVQVILADGHITANACHRDFHTGQFRLHGAGDLVQCGQSLFLGLGILDGFLSVLQRLVNDCIRIGIRRLAVQLHILDGSIGRFICNDFAIQSAKCLCCPTAIIAGADVLSRHAQNFFGHFIFGILVGQGVAAGAKVGPVFRVRSGAALPGAVGRLGLLLAAGLVVVYILAPDMAQGRVGFCISLVNVLLVAAIPLAHLIPLAGGGAGGGLNDPLCALKIMAQGRVGCCIAFLYHLVVAAAALAGLVLFSGSGAGSLHHDPIAHVVAQGRGGILPPVVKVEILCALPLFALRGGAGSRLGLQQHTPFAGTAVRLPCIELCVGPGGFPVLGQFRQRNGFVLFCHFPVLGQFRQGSGLVLLCYRPVLGQFRQRNGLVLLCHLPVLGQFRQGSGLVGLGIDVGFVSLRVGFLLLGLGCRGLHLVGVRRQHGSRRGQGKTNGQHQSSRTSAQFVDFSHVPSSFNCCRVSGFACRP